MKALKSLLLLFMLSLFATSAAFAYSPKTHRSLSIAVFTGTNPQKFAEPTALPVTDSHIKHGTSARLLATGLIGGGDNAPFLTSTPRSYFAFSARASAVYGGLSVSVPKRFATSSASPRAPPL